MAPYAGILSQFIPLPWPSPRDQSRVGRRRHSHAYRVADQIAPQESAAEHQAAGRSGADAVDPRRVVKLGKLDDQGEY
jgi:hypothetical protein